MEGKYTFGRDTYIYNDCEGVKITSYTPIHHHKNKMN